MNPNLAPLARGDAIRQNIPVIDLGGLAGMHNPATVLSVANETRDACRNQGEFRHRRADSDFANIGKEVQISDYAGN